MEKKKVAIVTLGDSRREFYKKREAIVASEIEKVKKAFGDKYDLYISPIVFDTWMITASMPCLLISSEIFCPSSVSNTIGEI